MMIEPEQESYYGGATFTMRLKRVIELTGGTTEIVGGVTKLTGGNIGLSDYPLFDENYRDHLTGRIVDRFWNREIGQETVDMFQMMMRRTMNEVMPFYNKMYLSEKIAYDPLSTIDIRSVTSSTSDQRSNTSGQSESEAKSVLGSRTVNSDTPQTMLAKNADYATAAVDVGSDNDSTATLADSRSDETESENASDSHTTGYQGIASDLIVAYRNSLLNIDLSVISELEPCFMQVFNNTNRYFHTRGYML
jgi:hypothetical protein